MKRKWYLQLEGAEYVHSLWPGDHRLSVNCYLICMLQQCDAGCLRQNRSGPGRQPQRRNWKQRWWQSLLPNQLLYAGCLEAYIRWEYLLSEKWTSHVQPPLCPDLDGYARSHVGDSRASQGRFCTMPFLLLTPPRTVGGAVAGNVSAGVLPCCPAWMCWEVMFPWGWVKGAGGGILKGGKGVPLDLLQERGGKTTEMRMPGKNTYWRTRDVNCGGTAIITSQASADKAQCWVAGTQSRKRASQRSGGWRQRRDRFWRKQTLNRHGATKRIICVLSCVLSQLIFRRQRSLYG